MGIREILTAYQEHLLTALEATEQAGVDTIEQLYDAVELADGRQVLSGERRAEIVGAPLAAATGQIA